MMTGTEQLKPQLRLVGTLSPASLARVNGIRRQLRCRCYESEHKLDLAVSRLLEDLSGRGGSRRPHRVSNGTGSGNKNARPSLETMVRASQTVKQMVTQTINPGKPQSLPALDLSIKPGSAVEVDLRIVAATTRSLLVSYHDAAKRAWVGKSMVQVLGAGTGYGFSRVRMSASLYTTLRDEL